MEWGSWDGGIGFGSAPEAGHTKSVAANTTAAVPRRKPDLRGPLSERSVVSATTTAAVRPVSRLWRGRCAGHCATSGTQAAPDESALPAARKTAYGGATGTTE